MQDLWPAASRRAAKSIPGLIRRLPTGLDFLHDAGDLLVTATNRLLANPLWGNGLPRNRGRGGTGREGEGNRIRLAPDRLSLSKENQNSDENRLAYPSWKGYAIPLHS